MLPGDAQEISVVSMFSDGIERSIPSSEVKWTSSNTSVAKFMYGKLEAVKAGKTKVMAEYKGSKVSVEIEVRNFTEVEPKENVEKDKNWTVTFSTSVNFNTIKEKNIYVADETGSVVPMLYYVEKGQQSKVTLIPVKSYKAGGSYTLWIKDVKSATGSSIKEFSKMNFVIAK